MRLAEFLAEQMDGTRDWTLKLLADVSGEDWTFQPAAGLPHVAFLCGHLAVSQHLLVHVRCLGRAVLTDEFVAHFPIGVAVKSAAEHRYPPAEVLLTELRDVHVQTLAAVRGMSDDVLAEAAYGKDGAAHPHYSTKRGAITHCLRHEAFHAGQIATIRRLRGKPFLR
jgi:uncharacterized damage-inducible protein DinB